MILGYRCRSPPFIFSVIGITVGADVGVHIDIDFCIQLIIISVMLISVVLHFVLWLLFIICTEFTVCMCIGIRVIICYIVYIKLKCVIILVLAFILAFVFALILKFDINVYITLIVTLILIYYCFHLYVFYCMRNCCMATSATHACFAFVCRWALRITKKQQTTKTIWQKSKRHDAAGSVASLTCSRVSSNSILF